jgi:hypothetical protein
MLLIHILLSHIPSVVMARDEKNSIYMMGFYFELINSAFQVVLFEFCLCRKFMRVDLWAILVPRKLSKYLLITSSSLR